MIGKKIKQIRLKKGLSLTELATKADVAKSYLSAIERDIQSNPSILFLQKISTVLGVEIETFLQEENQEDEWVDGEWLSLAQEAMELGITKNQFRQLLMIIKDVEKADKRSNSVEGGNP